MTIFEPNKVDIVMTVNEGPQLMIVDPGTEPDLKKWAVVLEEKLKHYVHVIRSNEFKNQYGNHRNASIVIVSPKSLEDVVKNIELGYINDDGKEVKIPVKFEQGPAPSFG